LQRGFSEDFILKVKRAEIIYLVTILGAHLLVLYLLRMVLQSPNAHTIFLVSLSFWLLISRRILVPSLRRQDRKELDQLLDQA